MHYSRYITKADQKNGLSYFVFSISSYCLARRFSRSDPFSDHVFIEPDHEVSGPHIIDVPETHDGVLPISQRGLCTRITIARVPFHPALRGFFPVKETPCFSD